MQIKSQFHYEVMITPPDPNEMASKPSFGQPEAKSACANLSLTTVDYGRYLVVMRSAFDVMISGEPYLALMLLLDMDTGNFLTRYGCINQVTMYCTQPQILTINLPRSTLKVKDHDS